MLENISILAGSRAINMIRDEGLDPSRVKVLAGASGSAKFLVLGGIDRVLAAMFAGRKDPLYLVGTSIGAFRMAAFCQRDPVRALDLLESAYIDQQYSLKPSKAEITTGTLKILDTYIADTEIPFMLKHPFMHLNFLSNRSKGILQMDSDLFQFAGLGLAAGMNLIGRKSLGLFFERALFSAPGKVPPFYKMDGFPIRRHSLARENFKSALLSSGSIPIAMQAVSNIEGSPGSYLDGGILDYHLDLPFLTDDKDKLVLFPHFYQTITPGWFDKGLNRKPMKKNMENVVLIAPSNDFVKTLPLGKIPDRKDFYLFRGNDDKRKTLWQTAADKSRILGEILYEVIHSGKIRYIVKPLETR